MKKIYLFCSAGMSTSMLASNMQSVANAHNLPIKVAAFSHNKLEEIIEKDTPDCILLGPQVKYMYEETVEQFGNTGIPIAVIDQAAFANRNKTESTIHKLLSFMVFANDSRNIYLPAYN